jgi:hypothetical protein
MDYTYGKKHLRRIGSRSKTFDWLRPFVPTPKKNQHKQHADEYARHAALAYVDLNDRKYHKGLLDLDGWEVDPLSTEETSIMFKDGRYVIAAKGTRPEGVKDMKNIYDKNPLPYIGGGFGGIKSAFDRIGNTIKDFTTDFKLATGQITSTDRYKEYLDLVQQVQARNPDAEIILTGHSLGGSLAHNAAIELDLYSYTYNRGSDVSEVFSDNASEKQISYRTEGDFVSSTISATETFEVKEGHGAHDLENFYS